MAVPEPPAGALPAIVAVGAGYFAGCAAIGWWAARRTRTVTDFYVAGASLGVGTLAIAAMAATLSGFAFIGGPGLFQSIGAAALFIVLSAAVTSALTPWMLATRLRLLHTVRGVLTVPAAIGARYRSPLAQRLAAVAILVAVTGYVATNFLALGILVDALFDTGRGPGIWLSAALVVAYTATGGILAGVYADVFQGTLMALASTLVFTAALADGGGLAGMSRAVLEVSPAAVGPWGSAGPVTALSLYFVFGVGSLAQPHIVHKFYMLRDPRRLKWYPALMTGAMLLTLLLFVGVGLGTRAAVARGALAPLASPDDATPAFLFAFTPPWLTGLVLSGVAAAIMSTVNSFLSIGAAALTADLPARGDGAPPSLRAGRVATVALAAAAAAAAHASDTLVAFLGIFGYGLFAAALVPALGIGLNWPGATAAGAVASIATGTALTLVGESLGYLGVVTLPRGAALAGVALVASTLVFLAVSWATRARAGADLDDDIRLILET